MANNKFYQVTEKHGGKNFLIRPDMEYIKHDGAKDFKLIEWSHGLVNLNSIFVDIGTRSGEWTVYLAEKCKEVHSFEACKSKYMGLCGTIALNGIFNVNTYNYSISSIENNGMIRNLNIFDNNGNKTSMDEEIISKENNYLGSEKVICRTLDSFGLDNISLIRIDINGCELDVFEGARTTILKCNPVILFTSNGEEWYNDKKIKTFQYLVNELNYEISNISNFDNTYLAKKRI